MLSPAEQGRARNMERNAAKLAELEVAQAAQQLQAEGASSSGARRKRRRYIKWFVVFLLI